METSDPASSNYCGVAFELAACRSSSSLCVRLLAPPACHQICEIFLFGIVGSTASNCELPFQLITPYGSYTIDLLYRMLPVTRSVLHAAAVPCAILRPMMNNHMYKFTFNVSYFQRVIDN